MADMREGSASGPVSTGSSPPHQTMALAAMLFAVSMTFIDQTIVAIAAPSIVDELDLSSSGMQFVGGLAVLVLFCAYELRVSPRHRRSGHRQPGQPGAGR